MEIRIRRHRDQEKSTDELLSRFICVYLLVNALNSLLQDVFGISGLTLQIVKAALGASVFFFLLKAAIRFTRNRMRILIVCEVLALLMYIYSFFAGVSIGALASWAVNTLGVCVPLAVSMAFIRDKDVLYGYFIWYSWPILAVLLINMLGTTDSMYNHHFSYALVFVMLLHLNELISRGKKRYIFMIVIEAVMLLGFGSRGAVVCIAAYLVLNVFNTFDNVYKRLIYIAVTITVALVIFFSYTSILSAVFRFVTARGFNGRTLRLLMAGNFASHDAGRYELWKKSAELVMERPLFGWGIRGAVRGMGHPYPHNIILDLALSFGIPSGLFLAAVLVFLTFRGFHRSRGTGRSIMILLFSISMVTLLFSSTLFTNYYFFMYLGTLFLIPAGKGRKTLPAEA